MTAHARRFVAGLIALVIVTHASAAYAYLHLSISTSTGTKRSANTLHWSIWNSDMSAAVSLRPSAMRSAR